MEEKNPTIKGREFKSNEPGKRLYFYPKYKTVATSENAARNNSIDVTKEQKPKSKSKEQGKKKPVKT